jgi:hypothetical protein
MDELVVQQTELDKIAEEYNLILNIDDFDSKILKQF